MKTFKTNKLPCCLTAMFKVVVVSVEVDLEIVVTCLEKQTKLYLSVRSTAFHL